MISNLNKTDFLKRLEENTVYGNPRLKGVSMLSTSLFVGGSDKMFFGCYNEKEFRLTKNSDFLPIPYIFEGEIKSIDNNYIEILLEIKPRLFFHLLLVFFEIVLILFNYFLTRVEESFGADFYLMEITFLLIMLLPIWIKIRQKKTMLKKFYKMFELRENNNHKGL